MPKYWSLLLVLWHSLARSKIQAVARQLWSANWPDIYGTQFLLWPFPVAQPRQPQDPDSSVTTLQTFANSIQCFDQHLPEQKSSWLGELSDEGQRPKPVPKARIQVSKVLPLSGFATGLPHLDENGSGQWLQIGLDSLFDVFSVLAWIVMDSWIINDHHGLHL